MNMKQWLSGLVAAPVKLPMPVLSFPSIQLLGVGVQDLICDSGLQAEGMRLVAERNPATAAVSMMDLSVEAEAFGSDIRISGDEVPTVTGHIVETMAQAQALAVPCVGTARTGLYIQAIEKACALITDRPVLAGVIGPFSLAGRLLDVSEAMIYCYEEPELVHAVLEKTARFLIDYILAYRDAGAHGVVMAEPLAGLLSPALNDEFSVDYVRQIVDAVQTDAFIVVYHNCGNATLQQTQGILSTGAAAYHFGNAIDMAQMLERMPQSVPVMGNIDPAGQFCNGTPDSVRAATLALLEACGGYPNFIISSGCDIPPLSSWDNIDAFFQATRDFYAKK